METPVVRLLIERGLIPKDILDQLQRWKLLPLQEIDQASGDQGCLDVAWGTGEKFVETLRCLIEEENRTIRETDLEVTGTIQRAHFVIRNEFGPGEVISRDVIVDRFGRLHVGALELEGVTFEQVGMGDELLEALGALRRITKCEPRYQGEKEVSYVITAEEQCPRGPDPEPAT